MAYYSIIAEKTQHEHVYETPRSQAGCQQFLEVWQWFQDNAGVFVVSLWRERTLSKKPFSD